MDMILRKMRATHFSQNHIHKARRSRANVRGTMALSIMHSLQEYRTFSGEQKSRNFSGSD